MDLGIKGLSQGLQSISFGRLYAISCADEYLATRLVSHYLASISKLDILRFLATQLRSEVFTKNCPAKLLNDIKAHVYSINESSCITSAMPYELRFLKKLPSGSVAVILMDVEVLKALDADSRARFFKDLYYSCCRKSAAVLVCYGKAFEKLAVSLLENTEFLSGISSLGYQKGSPYLDILLWRDQGRIARDQAVLILDEQGFERRNVNDGEIQSADDKGVCYLKKSTLDFDRKLYDRIKVFNTNEEVFSDALDKATAASVFLCIENRQELEKTARMVYELRHTLGNFLHIFILDKVNGLRASSIRFLLACGADFVFDANARSPYINAVLPLLLSSDHRGFAVGSFDDLYKGYCIMEDESKGFLVFKDFAAKVGAALDDTPYLQGAGTLVKLIPKSCFTPEDCINIFRPKRGGDFCTVRGDFVLVFISSCLGSEILTALRNIFTVDPLSVFAASCVYLSHEDIIRALNVSIEDDDCRGEDLLLGRGQQESEQNMERRISTEGISSYITTADDIKARPSSTSHLLKRE